MSTCASAFLVTQVYLQCRLRCVFPIGILCVLCIIEHILAPNVSASLLDSFSLLLDELRLNAAFEVGLH
jgi:hypothetical protein